MFHSKNNRQEHFTEDGEAKFLQLPSWQRDRTAGSRPFYTYHDSQFSLHLTLNRSHVRMGLSVLCDWLWPCPGKMAGPSSCLQSSASSTEPDMRESVSARLVPAARSWSDVYFARSGDLKLRPYLPGAGILKFFQGHGMLDGSSSRPPHTETWHCAESSFSKSIFVDTTF